VNLGRYPGKYITVNVRIKNRNVLRTTYYSANERFCRRSLLNSRVAPCAVSFDRPAPGLKAEPVLDCCVTDCRGGVQMHAAKAKAQPLG
jgi:hypothetical protein